MAARFARCVAGVWGALLGLVLASAARACRVEVVKGEECCFFNTPATRAPAPQSAAYLNTLGCAKEKIAVFRYAQCRGLSTVASRGYCAPLVLPYGTLFSLPCSLWRRLARHTAASVRPLTHLLSHVLLWMTAVRCQPMAATVPHRSSSKFTIGPLELHTTAGDSQDDSEDTSGRAAWTAGCKLAELLLLEDKHAVRDWFHQERACLSSAAAAG